MIKIIIPIIFIFLFMTVRLPAQNAQVSPVAALNQQTTSVVNNNFQTIQTGINGVFGLFASYFTNGFLNTANGGTGVNSGNWSTGSLVAISPTGKWTSIAAGTTGDTLVSQGPGIVPAYTTLVVPTPKTLISTWSDTTGATQANSGTTTHFFVIDSGTDWAGKNITIIASTEYRGDASFASSVPNIINTSATALSAMSFTAASASGAVNFIIWTLTLPTNSFTLLKSNTFGGGEGNRTHGIGIGTDASGHLCLVASNNHVANGATDTVFTQMAGTILRTP